MGSTTVKIEHTQLPEYTSHARELQWQMQFWQYEYAQAALMKSKAWKMYDEAVEEGLPKDELDEFYMCAEMFDAMCDETWHQWQDTKRAYLELLN